MFSIYDLYSVLYSSCMLSYKVVAAIIHAFRCLYSRLMPSLHRPRQWFSTGIYDSSLRVNEGHCIEVHGQLSGGCYTIRERGEWNEKSIWVYGLYLPWQKTMALAGQDLKLKTLMNAEPVQRIPHKETYYGEGQAGVSSNNTGSGIKNRLTFTEV